MRAGVAARSASRSPAQRACQPPPVWLLRKPAFALPIRSTAFAIRRERSPLVFLKSNTRQKRRTSSGRWWITISGRRPMRIGSLFARMRVNAHRRKRPASARRAGVAPSVLQHNRFAVDQRGVQRTRRPRKLVGRIGKGLLLFVTGTTFLVFRYSGIQVFSMPLRNSPATQSSASRPT